MDTDQLFAIKLVDNEKKIRDKALSKLRKYIESRSNSKNDKFKEEDFIKLWKGLHYCLWMCDKPLIQEELCTRICNLISCFNKKASQIILFIKIYFQTILREWNRIDKWRMDKFMMQMRLMLNKTFEFLNDKKWKKPLIIKFNNLFFDYPLNINDDSYPDGVAYHFTDIFLDEMGKYGEQLTEANTFLLLQPFMKAMAISKKKPFVIHIQKRIFIEIIECSDVGIEPEMEEEMKEIKAYGLQRGETEDDTEHALKFNYLKMHKQLKKLLGTIGCLTRNKKIIEDLSVKFKKLSKNIYPIDESLPDLEKSSLY